MDPAVERCAGCELTRVYCQSCREMDSKPCCDGCSH